MTLAVPKRKVPVKVHMQGAVERVGFMLVETISPHHSGPQALSEYLHQSDSFVPFFQEGATEVSFLSKESIAVVTVKEDDEQGEIPEGELPLVPDDDEEAAPEVKVEMELRDGSSVCGELVWAMRPAYRRVIDYLNQAARFLVLREGEELHIVNKHFVRSARPLPAGS
ncbi:MAG: hypothetical protein U0166_25820 [Acidobacteriota bacterium]